MTYYFRYAAYVLRHKLEVFKWCWRFGIPWRGIWHDCSKFSPAEFGPHARYFYGPPEKRNIASLDAAFLRHIHRNKHHFNYWMLIDHEGYVLCADMPLRYRKEMLADWLAKGASQGQDAIDWYERHSATIGLHPDTRAWLETQLEFWSRRNGSATH